MNHERFFAENLAVLDQVVQAVARRYHLSPNEADDLGGSVRLKLVENDCEALRRFEQRSSLRTYLAVVVHRHFLDERIRRWGRWRPCQQARRAGPLAVLLDRLLTRDGLSFDEACEVLKTNHGVAESRADLYNLSLSFPDRTTRRYVGEEELSNLEARVPGPDRELEDSHAKDQAAKVNAAFSAALEVLPVQDRLLLKLHYSHGRPLSQISRLLDVAQKPLYRRLESLRHRLRRELEARGVSREQVLSVIGHPAFEPSPLASNEEAS